MYAVSYPRILADGFDTKTFATRAEANHYAEQRREATRQYGCRAMADQIKVEEVK